MGQDLSSVSECQCRMRAVKFAQLELVCWRNLHYPLQTHSPHVSSANSYWTEYCDSLATSKSWILEGYMKASFYYLLLYYASQQPRSFHRFTDLQYLYKIIIIILINLKLLILFVHNPNVVCYVVLCYLSSSSFVCLLFCSNVFFLQYLPVIGARCGVVGWSTMLQAGKSWVRVPMRWSFQVT
jgi:hypothetical protein